MTGYIYCYTNKINGKKYIGQTTKTLEERADKNGRGYSTQFKFGKAIEKYGWDNFSAEIIETVELEDSITLHSRLNELEKHYIELFNTYYAGYNSDLGDNSHEVSEETRLKLSTSLKGKKKYSNINYIKAAQERKGIPLSSEIKEKISKTKLKNRSTEGYINKNKGKKHSADWNKKVSESTKGRQAWNKGKTGKNRMEQNDLLKKLQQITLAFKDQTGRNSKKELLIKYKDDNDFKQLLKYVYDPFIIFGIGKKKLEKDLKSNINNNNDYKFFDLLKYLSEHNTGSYKEVHLARCFIDKHSEYKDFICSVITKNLILGIDVKTINSIIPNLCNTFNVMLANKYFDKPEVIEGKEFAITTKIDGMRCIMLKENDNVTFWSRQGQQIEGLVDLEKEAKEYFPDNICLDGELVAISDNPDTYKDTMKRARNKDLEKHGLKMKVFDYMPIEDFKTQTSTLVYAERRAILEDIFDSICLKKDGELRKEGKYLRGCDKFPEYFDLLRVLYRGTDTSKIIEWLDAQTAEGEEGVMINQLDAPYEFKRTSVLLKCKKFQDTELEIIGFEEGTNKLSGTLGALVCKYKDSACKVGSGFTEELRKAIWTNKDEWLGKIITVKYFEESYDSKTGKPSLRFPIFLRVREDI